MNNFRSRRNVSVIGYVWKYLTSKDTSPINIMSRNIGAQRTIRGTLIHIPQKTQFHTSKVTLKVIGCGGKGMPKCLFVESDRMNYLFNCGEGTQRLANEHKCRLPKLKNIFLTVANWTNLGGLPGLFLTMQAFQIEDVSISGPVGTIDILNAVRHFVCLDKISVNDTENLVTDTYEDHVMTVSSVIIQKAAQENTVKRDNNETAKRDRECSIKRPTSEEEDCGSPPRKMQKTNPEIGLWDFPDNTEKIEHIVSYICKLKPTMGTLSLEKCLDKGIQPGPNLRLLKEGNDVTLPDGTVIYSKDVCTPQIEGLQFAVVECPSEEYLDNFVNHEAFKKYHQSSQNSPASLYCIVHFTTQRILNNPKYKKWMDDFGPATYHLILNETNECLGGTSVYKNQWSLHSVAPDIFPLLAYAPTPSAVIKKEDGCGPIIPGVTLCTISLKPKPGVQFDHLLESPEALYAAQLKEMTPVRKSILAIREKYEEESKLFADSKEYPKVVMLGTGSSVPNKVRNVSGILIRLDEKHSIILDCGEGTYGQLCKYYGKKKVNDIVASIKMIYVSHIHADHHLGMLSLMIARHAITSEPVTLLLPERLSTWLSYYSSKFQNIDDYYQAFQNREFMKKNETNEWNKSANAVFKAMKIESVQTAMVAHCANSYGIAITLESGEKIVYSGDTMPCQSLVSIGKDCDLLIHEATMEDGLEDQARKKLHSTMSQAIQIGRKMNAKNILLTHFSQRYSKLPYLPDSIKNWTNIAIAYDYMEFSISKFPLLCLLSPAYEIIYSQFKEVLQERAVKRMGKNAVLDKS